MLALAGPDRTVSRTSEMNPQPFHIAYLNGAESTGDSFSWTVIDYTPNVQAQAPFAGTVGEISGAKYELTSDNTPVTGFFADTTGTYTIQLTVQNSGGDAAFDTVQVTVLDDQDGDGNPDSDDLDRDGDGFLNDTDAFPDDRNTHLDHDNDGIGNYYETDVDGDGVPDLADDFPLDPAKTQLPIYAETKEIPATTDSNQNDQTEPSIAEDAGVMPKKITGYIAARDNLPDLDCYRVSFAAGHYSLVMSGQGIGMTPTVSVFDANGDVMAQAQSNLLQQAAECAISLMIPADGEYYIFAADGSGDSHPTWRYTIAVFEDDDLDGVPNDLEMALDANHLSNDSDGDGIPDFNEIHVARANWQLTDTDGDLIPLWWDLDSDGDRLADTVEYFSESDKPGLDMERLARLNDMDGDGHPNFNDPDADGNGISDYEECVPDLAHPLDTNGDGIPDFLDVDDDGDGLLDLHEASGLARRTPLENEDDTIETPMGLLELVNETLNGIDAARAGDAVKLSGANLPTDLAATWIVLRLQEGGPINLNPTSADPENAAFIWPQGISEGAVEIFIAYDNKRTNAVWVVNADLSPILTDITYNPATRAATLKGVNLNVPLEIHFTGDMLNYDNSGGSSTEVEVPIPASLEPKSGYAYIKTSGGASNLVWVALTRLVNGEVVVPAGAALDVTELEVSFSIMPDDAIYPDANGQFSTEVDISLPTAITSIIEREDGQYPPYAAYLSALVIPEEESVLLNSRSTALNLTYMGLDLTTLLDQGHWTAARDLLAGLPEITRLGNVIETKLAVDPYLLADLMPDQMDDPDLEAALEAALVAGAKAVEAQILSGAFQLSRPNHRLQKELDRKTANTDPLIEPFTEYDDISIYETDKESRNLTIENDTQMYLSAKFIGDYRRVLRPHDISFDGMVGGQSSLLYWAKTKAFDVPGGQSCIVEVVTAGIDDKLNNGDGPSEVWKWLIIRTAIERVVLNGVKCFIKMRGFKPHFLVDFLLSHGAKTGVRQVILGFKEGNVAKATLGLLNVFWDDLTKPPEGGPITKAIVKKIGKEAIAAALTKAAGKWGATLIPGLGQVALAIKVYEKINYGASVVLTIDDIARTDQNIEFLVKYPLYIKKVIPNRVRQVTTNLGGRIRFHIKGEGFSPMEHSGVELEPEVVFQEPMGGLKTKPEITGITPGGTDIIAYCRRIAFSGEIQEPRFLNVYVSHPNEAAAREYDIKPLSAVKPEAIEIVPYPVVDTLVPDNGPVGSICEIYGVGFHDDEGLNQVQLGGLDARILASDYRRIKIVIPDIPGLYYNTPYSIRVRSKDHKELEWSDWSPEHVDAKFTVTRGPYAFRIIDPQEPDDAFALYINKFLVGTLYAREDHWYKDVYVDLPYRENEITLKTVVAPDGIGSYRLLMPRDSYLEIVGGSHSVDGLMAPGESKSWRIIDTRIYAGGNAADDRPAAGHYKAFPYEPSLPSDLERMETAH